MFVGYNTNGFAHHDLVVALDILAEIGYRGIALTLDVHHLNPLAHNLPGRVAELRARAEMYDFRFAVETGARFLLDPVRKHQPTLLTDDADHRQFRFDFLRGCVKTAAQLRADCVSFWSGSATHDVSPSVLMTRLVEECKRLADFAASKNVRLSFEPEPGMFIDTMDKFAELHARVNHPSFGLTVDVGHLVCNNELPVSKFLTQWKHLLWNIHIEDMKAGVHDHLMFGEGEVDFADVFNGLRAANYTGGVYVELSRHSHDAVNTARKAKEFLDPFVTSERPR